MGPNDRPIPLKSGALTQSPLVPNPTHPKRHMCAGECPSQSVFSTMVGGENCRQRKLSRSVFSKKFSSCDNSQTGTNIEDPSGDNVHDMEENNISKYRFDSTVED